jgi:hypothetical protein
MTNRVEINNNRNLWDYCPVVGFFTAAWDLSDLFACYTLIPQKNIRAKEICYAKIEIQLVRCVFLIVPVFGNIIVWLLDRAQDSAQGRRKTSCHSPLPFRSLEKNVDSYNLPPPCSHDFGSEKWISYKAENDIEALAAMNYNKDRTEPILEAIKSHPNLINKLHKSFYKSLDFKTILN